MGAGIVSSGRCGFSSAALALVVSSVVVEVEVDALEVDVDRDIEVCAGRHMLMYVPLHQPGAEDQGQSSQRRALSRVHPI